MDLAFMGGKLTIVADYYWKQTSDLLLEQPLPLYLSQSIPEGGYWGNYGISGSYWTNAGLVQNNGFEVNVDYTAISSQDFSWNLNLNVSRFVNSVTDLGGPEMIPVAASWGIPTHRVALDKPIGAFYLYHYDGVWKEEEAEEADLYYASPGEPKYLDVNQDSTINEEDIIYAGQANPDLVWGLNQTLRYKNFSLNILITGSHGGKIYNLNYAFTMSQHLLSSTATHADALDYYDAVTNPDSETPSIIQGERFNSTRFLQDASYVKVKNISLNYYVPKSVLKVCELDVFASVKNLFTFTDYKGYDPELSSTGQQDNLAGFDMSSYPVPRTFVIGIKATF
jgi:hypothetical protein